MKLKSIIVVCAFGTINNAFATAFTDIEVGAFGPPATTDTLEFNPALAETPMLLTPIFSATGTTHTIGEYCHPTDWSHATSATSILSCYNLTMGDSTTPIPSTAYGAPTGYESNIYTAQTPTQVDNPDGALGYGTSITTTGGATSTGYAADIHIEDVAAVSYGFNVGMSNDVGGGLQWGFKAQSQGSHPPYEAFSVLGNWVVGLDLGGNAAIGATNIYFATPASPGPVAATDYSIVGGLTDTLRITGGGSAHGMIIDGGPATNTGGPVRFRPSDTVADVAAIDTTTGNIISGGNVGATALILKDSSGTGCHKITVSNTGVISAATATCLTP